MNIKLPKLIKYIYENKSNEICHYINDNTILENAIVISSTPFIVRHNDTEYLFTSNNNDPFIESYEHVILTSKKPTNKNILSGDLKLIKWIKNPNFPKASTDEVIDTWKNTFKFIKEDEKLGIKGLRSPQLGALFSILSHAQNVEDRAIIIMPTGTGKTETMLSTLISNQCKKLLVTVPSDALRTQISQKFLNLGLLKELKIVDPTCLNPIVGTIRSKFNTTEELRKFIDSSNVIVTTMDMLASLDINQKKLLNECFTHLFVDEAHHSEAKTWSEVINTFNKEKVFLFTATPYRNDGKTLKGKIIYNFSLRKAQEQKYYKEINYIPIREYDKKLADEKIADKAVEQLEKDLNQGYNHILMARCVSKNRALEVYEHYKKYSKHNPVVIYTGVADLNKKIESIKKGDHSIIICVNMLGEGFDLPNLKIAAIHDERQSIPITLQFIGRFTRTSYDKLGKASFITNVAYPPILEELNELYARNSDWNILLPRISKNATEKEINIKEFLDNFKNLSSSEIPFGEINPSMSTIMYKNTTKKWFPLNWQSGFPNLDNYEHVFSDTNHKDTLVIILGKIEKVDWGNFETVQNLQWDIIIVHWDYRPGINRVFINTSLKQLQSKSLIDSIFGDGTAYLFTGTDVFKIFHEVKRLRLFNVGTRKGLGQDVTFQSYYGKGVQDGINELEQGNLSKNNIFGVGYKNGEKITLGCSIKGKIWSYQRGNLDELTKWCRHIGDLLEDPNIDPNIVLQHTLKVEKISSRPTLFPIFIDWHYSIYEHSEERFQFNINGNLSDVSNTELSILNPSTSGNLKFSLSTDKECIDFEIILGEDPKTLEKYFKIIKLTPINCLVSHGKNVISIEIFFEEYSPTIWFADGSHLFQNIYVKLKEFLGKIPLDKITTDKWPGVDISKESQDIDPYVQDSIQYYFINKIRNEFEMIYDDDGKGEIADIIAINNFEDFIDIHLFHLKYAHKGIIGNNIENFYQVCGQAQKALKWKYRDGKHLINHLFKRKIKTLNGLSCKRLIKGTEDDLEDLLSQARFTKPMKFHMHIVQPSLSKASASNDILLLLGSTYQYLSTVGNVDLLVYTSE